MIKKKQLLEFVVSNEYLREMLKRYGQLKRWLYQFIPGEIIDVNIFDLNYRVTDNISAHLSLSPHYKHLQDGVSYTNYLKERGVSVGYPVHSTPEKFERLKDTLEYLSKKYKRHHIIVIRTLSCYVVVDGLHRSSIILDRVEKCYKDSPRTSFKIQVKVINSFWQKFMD